MLVADDDFWMRKAIAVASSKGTNPATSPIGAIIVVGETLEQLSAKLVIGRSP
jgi:tRNA(Arg) A34 adenosine deaminase TadA